MKFKYLIVVCLVFTVSNSYATTIDGSTLNTLSVLSSAGLGSTLVTTAEIGSLATGAGVAVAIGAGVAYYAKTGENPVYAAASSIASAADSVFIPAYQAFKATFVSPESFPASAAQYIGKEGSVGSTLGNLLDFVKSNSTSYPDLAAYLNSHKLDDTYPDPGTFQTGQVISIKDKNYTINSNWSQTSTVLVSNWQTGAYYAAPTYIIVDSHMSLYIPATGSTILYWATDSYYTSQNKLAYKVYSRSLANTTNPPQIFPTPSFDFPSIKDSFAQANSDQAIKDQLIQSVAAIPSSQKIISANPIPASVPASSSSPITNNDISNFFTANTTNVYNKYLDTAANAGDVDTAQAAAELAKVQEEEASKEADNQASAPSLTIPQRHAVTFQPIIDARNLTMTKAPFTWFGTLPGILHDLVASPSPPHYTIDLGFLQQEIDLSFLDSFASTCRSIIAFFMYLMTVFLMIKIFRTM